MGHIGSENPWVFIWNDYIIVNNKIIIISQSIVYPFKYASNLL